MQRYKASAYVKECVREWTTDLYSLVKVHDCRVTWCGGRVKKMRNAYVIYQIGKAYVNIPWSNMRVGVNPVLTKYQMWYIHSIFSAGNAQALIRKLLTTKTFWMLKVFLLTSTFPMFQCYCLSSSPWLHWICCIALWQRTQLASSTTPFSTMQNSTHQYHFSCDLKGPSPDHAGNFAYTLNSVTA